MAIAPLYHETDPQRESAIFSDKPDLGLVPDLSDEETPALEHGADMTIQDTMSDFFSIRGVAEKVRAMRKRVDERGGPIADVEFLLPEARRPVVVGSSIADLRDI